MTISIDKAENLIAEYRNLKNALLAIMNNEQAYTPLTAYHESFLIYTNQLVPLMMKEISRRQDELAEHGIIETD